MREVKVTPLKSSNIRVSSVLFMGAHFRDPPQSINPLVNHWKENVFLAKGAYPRESGIDRHMDDKQLGFKLTAVGA